MKRRILFLTLLFTFLIVNVYSQTVYVTNSGTKYHKEGCRYLSKSKIAINLSDAIAKGYGACSVCKPSSSVSNTATPQTKASGTETQKVSTQSTNSSQSASVQCSATTKAGTRCKRMTKSSNGKCYQHGGN